MWKPSLAFIKMICVSIKERFKIYDVTEFDVIPRRALLLSKPKQKPLSVSRQSWASWQRRTSRKSKAHKMQKFAFAWLATDNQVRKVKGNNFYWIKIYLMIAKCFRFIKCRSRETRWWAWLACKIRNAKFVIYEDAFDLIDTFFVSIEFIWTLMCDSKNPICFPGAIKPNLILSL